MSILDSLECLFTRMGFIVMVIYCCASIAIIIGVTVGLGVAYSDRQVCVPGAKFVDLPKNFMLKEQWIATYGSKATLNIDPEQYGTYDTDYTIAPRYVLRDINENVVAEARKGYFSLTFNITRCSGKGDMYEVEQRWFNIDKVEYELKKNGRLIAKPSKEIWFTCKPDITLETLVDEGETPKTLATIDRSCGESFFTDKWNIRNYYDTNYTQILDIPAIPGVNASTLVLSRIEPEQYIENYVLGFLAFLTTVAENDAAARSSSSTKKN